MADMNSLLSSISSSVSTSLSASSTTAPTTTGIVTTTGQSQDNYMQWNMFKFYAK
ncbi:unnamed protein product, partial [Onchocerca ochengi]|uniref:Reverse transcriptase domain-containing protein n=1 Tax=Onchocerca ochengi TaxID=42157 RepID=A0A182EWF4_ONCOC